MLNVDGRAIRDDDAIAIEKSPGHVISLYTRLRDPDAACELAARISEGLAGEPDVYAYSTTVSPEGNPASRRQVFVNVVPPRPAG